MTPEQRITQLEVLVAELSQWKLNKERQQLSFPVDEASKASLGAGIVTGAGSTSKTQTYTTSDSATVVAPKAYSQTFILLANGTQYEVPSLI